MKRKSITICCLFLLLTLLLTACKNQNAIYDEEASYGVDNTLTSTDHITPTTTKPTTSEPEPEYSKGLAYELCDLDRYYSVIGMGNCADINVIIPPTHNGKEVRYIQSFEGAENVKTLVIPNTVVGYVAGALKCCSDLEEITLPILFPAGHTLHGLFHESRNDDAYIPQKLKKVILTKETNIGEDAFVGFISIESIILPNTLTTIESNAFWGCTSLKALSIPHGVTSIGGGFIDRCNSLKSITLPSSLQKIDPNLLFRFRCTESIAVYYAGSVKQWNKLVESSRWFTPEITVICCDGEWQYTE